MARVLRFKGFSRILAMMEDDEHKSKNVRHDLYLLDFELLKRNENRLARMKVSRTPQGRPFHLPPNIVRFIQARTCNWVSRCLYRKRFSLRGWLLGWPRLCASMFRC